MTVDDDAGSARGNTRRDETLNPQGQRAHLERRRLLRGTADQSSPRVAGHGFSHGTRHHKAVPSQRALRRTETHMEREKERGNYWGGARSEVAVRFERAMDQVDVCQVPGLDAACGSGRERMLQRTIVLSPLSSSSASSSAESRRIDSGRQVDLGPGSERRDRARCWRSTSPGEPLVDRTGITPARRHQAAPGPIDATAVARPAATAAAGAAASSAVRRCRGRRRRTGETSRAPSAILAGWSST